MARMEVVQIRCDRCKRVELVPAGPPKENPDFEIHFSDRELIYEDLCARCKSTLANVWKDIEEWDRPLNQQFGPSLSSEKAAPLTPAPDYSPPKPHSAAAQKK